MFADEGVCVGTLVLQVRRADAGYRLLGNEDSGLGSLGGD